jgi:hypothetical protein
VLLDGTQVFTDVSTADTSNAEFGYVPVEPGVHALVVIGVETLLEGSLNIITGTDTTVMTVGDDPLQLLILNDDNSPPSQFDHGRVRVVNAAGNAASLDADIGDTSILDIQYPTASWSSLRAPTACRWPLRASIPCPPSP